jgi:hypothetical protein
MPQSPKRSPKRHSPKKRSPKRSPICFKYITTADAKSMVGKTVTFKGEQDSAPYKVKVMGFVPKTYIEKNGEKIYRTFSPAHNHLHVYKIKDDYEYQLFPHNGKYIDRAGWVKFK